MRSRLFNKVPSLPLAISFLLALLAVPANATEEEELLNEEGVPIYKIIDGQVDRGTYNGYRRYHSSCHVCHGAEGMGSSFAPALIESVRVIDYWTFMDVIANGRENAGATGSKVMPSFGTNPNVMQHVDDIYRYLKARSEGDLGPGRPTRFKG